MKRFAGATIGGALAVVNRAMTEAAECRESGRLCREHANCCSGYCGDQDATGHHRCGCPPGLTECNGTCVDLAADPANCGTCGNTCVRGQICCVGACGIPEGLLCEENTDCCSGSCTAEGICCAGGVTCNGACCESAGAVCDGFGDCCETGVVCGGICCPDAAHTCCGTSPINQVCCPAGRCTEDGLCCAGGKSCNEVGGGLVCCQSADAECIVSGCCESGNACSPDNCCANATDVCCSTGTDVICCPAGTTCPDPPTGTCS